MPTPTPPGNEEDTKNSDIARSRDPNDKLAPAGYGRAAFLPTDNLLAYRIRFENMGSATAPAQQVVVTDTLDADLDLSTFQLTEITFANQTITVPYGLDHYETTMEINANGTPILVEIDASLDFATRTLTLTLSAIDPLTGWFPEDPLVGLLYPNDDTGRGEGSISYVVSPRAALPTGTAIHNRARIVFDYNEAIDTPLVLNTIDARAPTSTVLPLPAPSTNTFLVQWSGQDDANGSGIASYDIYVSADRTNYFRWLDQTNTTSAIFTGAPGTTYYFFSVARDQVGNEELAPTTPDAQITLPQSVELRVTAEFDLPNDRFVLTWNSETGKRYRVVYKNDLGDAQWVDLGEVSATGSSASFNDVLDSHPHRFYQIQTVP